MRKYLAIKEKMIYNQKKYMHGRILREKYQFAGMADTAGI